MQPAGAGEPPGNWKIHYRTYYRDTTPPTSATAPVHSDADAPAGHNNDSILTFAWTPGADPDSGAGQRIRIERQQGSAWCEVELGNGGSTSFDFQGTLTCATGSAASLTLAAGQSYRARIQTRNGMLPIIENPASVDGPDSGWVAQDALPVPALSPASSLLLALGLGAAAWLGLRRITTR